uniref:Uncharacterized protein n=1 Tax=Oryza sativa subsp. japonica TaxID=39947 RepID=Q6EQ68_ORYSJ|nr:hypothetical protein [Oryza sativa Japonica Group]BAD29202.1 hypothetical protein [Oryza sativa Japonica Group]
MERFTSKQHKMNDYVNAFAAIINVWEVSDNNQGNKEVKKDIQQDDLPVVLCMLQESLIELAPTISEDENIDNDNGTTFTQGVHSYDVLNMSCSYAILKQPIMETIDEIPLSQNNLFVVSSDNEEFSDISLIFIPQLVNEHSKIHQRSLKLSEGFT